jgi:hypothetical protein
LKGADFMELLIFGGFLLFVLIAGLALGFAYIYDIIVASWNQSPALTIIAGIMILAAIVFFKKLKDVFG